MPPPVLRVDDAQPHQAILSHPHKAPPCHLLHTKAFLGVSPSKQYQVTPSPAQFYYTRPVPETPHSTGGKNLHSASSTTSVEDLIISNFSSWRSFHLVQPAHQQHSTEPQTLAFEYFPLYQPGNHIFNNCFSTSWIQLTAEAGVLTSDDNSLTVIFTSYCKLIIWKKIKLDDILVDDICWGDICLHEWSFCSMIGDFLDGSLCSSVRIVIWNGEKIIQHGVQKSDCQGHWSFHWSQSLHPLPCSQLSASLWTCTSYFWTWWHFQSQHPWQ